MRSLRLKCSMIERPVLRFSVNQRDHVRMSGNKLCRNILLVITAMLSLLAVNAFASITAVTVTPSQQTMSVTVTNTVSLIWKATATSSHISGVTTAQALFVHPSTGATLGTASGTLSGSGSGPFSLSETLTISTSQVLAWQGLGLSKVLVRRTFGDSASTTTVAAEMALLIPVAAVGGLTGASVSPVQTSLSGTSNSSITASWQVSTASGHSTGATSSVAIVINPANGASLGSVGSTLSASGTGPFNLNETLNISLAQVQSWQAQSLSQVRLRRTFTDTATSTSATAEMILLVPAPLPTGLVSANVSPAQSSLSDDSVNNLSLTWQVIAASGHSTGLNSASASYIDPSNGSGLGNTGASLSGTGGGPFNLSESISISASQVQSWQSQGLTRVLLRRVFSDASTATSVTAEIELLVPEVSPIGLISAAVTPLQTPLADASGVSISLNWQVLAQSGHVSGLSSSNGSYIDVANGAVIGTAGTMLSAAGAGPFNLGEALTLSAVQIQNWQQQGVTEVLYRRTFSDPVSATSVVAESLILIPDLAALGGLLNAIGTPTPLQLSAGQVNNLSIRWQVIAQSGHTTGVSSAAASLQHPTNSTLLAMVGGSLSAAGAGPFSLNETISINQGLVQTWQAQGLDRVILTRNFTAFDSAGGNATEVTADIVLLVPSVSGSNDGGGTNGTLGLNSASVSPAQSVASAVTTTSLGLAWQISADTGYSGGVESNAVSVVDPSSGAVLGTMGMRLAAPGSAPYILNETLAISSGQVQTWQAMGLETLLLRRVFGDALATTQVTAELVLSLPVRGSVNSARVSPATSQAYASQDNTIMANWQVSTGTEHQNGIVSPVALVKNPRSGALLTEVAGSLSAAGSGPFFFNETLTLADDLVQTWVSKEIKQVVIERVFSDPVDGSKTMAAMAVSINSNALTAARNASESVLRVQGLRLEFDNGVNLALIDLNAEIKARLTLSYSGVGLLEGIWQVAEAGSTDSLPLYRTLMLVRENLSGSQRATLQSPALPSSRSGKYLVRFCVTGPAANAAGNNASGQCSEDLLSVNGSYQVQASGTVTPKITVLSPRQQTVVDTTPFSWQAFAEARIYRIQIFEKVAGQQKLASSVEQAEMSVPAFVSGQILPAHITSSALSELVRSKLQPGRLYQWRVTAHDQDGKVVASSSLFTFAYQPHE